MADQLPDIEGANEFTHEARPRLIVNPDGSLADFSGISGGSKDEGNSTEEPLGANEEFVGEWVTNNDPHVGIKVVADQVGEVFLETSMTGGATVDLQKYYVVRNGDDVFDSIVKMHGRTHRLRVKNGPVAQTRFEAQTSTGAGLYPFAKNDRDKPRGYAYGTPSAITAPTYALIIDLSDIETFPHRDTGRIDLYSCDIFYDKSNQGVGAVQVGVITRISNTDADITFVRGVSFNNASANQEPRDRPPLEFPLKLGVVDGNTPDFITNFKAANVTAVNSLSGLPNVTGTPIVPEIGDLIAFFNWSAGTYTAAVSGQYAGAARAT